MACIRADGQRNLKSLKIGLNEACHLARVKRLNTADLENKEPRGTVTLFREMYFFRL